MMASGQEILLGEEGSEQLRVRVLCRAYPGGLCLLDDNWLHAELIARAAGRRLRCPAFLRAPDLAKLSRSLARLAQRSCDRALLEPRCGTIRVAIRRAGDGFAAEVHARDDGSERSIAFGWDLDAARLDRLTREVAAVVEAFPPMARAPR